MKIMRSLVLACAGAVLMLGLTGFYQSSLASCDPPPAPPKPTSRT